MSVTVEVLNNPIQTETLVNNFIKDNDLKSAIDLYVKAYQFSKEKNGILHPITTAYVNKYSRLLGTFKIETIELKNMYEDINNSIINFKGEENINVMKGVI
jgi:hypothetical protein